MSTFEFEMGEFSASFPKSYRYAKNHMWARPSDEDAGKFQFGLTEYAVRLLQDVYFLEWIVDPGAELTDRMMIGAIESKKAESDLFTPITGTLVAINDKALDDPSIINADPYNEGWLLEIQGDDNPADENGFLLDASQYAEHLESAWEVAQRTIKGQANS